MRCAALRSTSERCLSTTTTRRAISRSRRVQWGREWRGSCDWRGEAMAGRMNQQTTRPRSLGLARRAARRPLRSLRLHCELARRRDDQVTARHKQCTVRERKTIDWGMEDERGHENEARTSRGERYNHRGSGWAARKRERASRQRQDREEVQRDRHRSGAVQEQAKDGGKEEEASDAMRGN